MAYLLDTHIVLWWLQDPNKLGAKARQVISDRTQGVFVSSVSFWEMSIKSSLGRLTIPRNMIDLLHQESFQFLSVDPEDGLSLIDLPDVHNDPFDRMLIVQAKRHDLTVITRDKQLAKYPVSILKA